MGRGAGGSGFVLLAVNQYMCTYFCQYLTNALLESAGGENDRRNDFMINIHRNYMADGLGFELSIRGSAVNRLVRNLHKKKTTTKQ